MKKKKTAWKILGIILAVILLIYLIIALLLPRGLGPIEPFLNLGDLFKSSDGTTPGKPAYYQKRPCCRGRTHAPKLSVPRGSPTWPSGFT